MDALIKIKIKQTGCSVEFAILEQDRRVYEYFKISSAARLFNNIAFHSSAYPELQDYGNKIALRGYSKNKDELVTSLPFLTQEEASLYVDKVKLAFEMLCDSIREATADEPADEPHGPLAMGYALRTSPPLRF